MYRNSASIPANNIVTSSGSSRDGDDSNSEVARLLNQKRREIEQEVALFKASKDQEFRDFEKSLLKSKHRRKRNDQPKKSASKANDGAAHPSALSLLAGVPRATSRVVDGDAAEQVPERLAVVKSAPSSKPTISLDRSNIKGQTTPPTGESPRPSEKLVRQISRSPDNRGTGPCADTSVGRDCKADEHRGPANSSNDSFAGVFTPSYLPLLESQQNQRPTNGQPPEIRLQRHNSFSHSQSSSEMFSPVSRSQRSQTAPILPSTSLPSALRTASGTAIRKRKHVTFQLADSAIVEPSSSYEEMPSPEPREESKNDVGAITEVMSNGTKEREAVAEDSDEGTIFPLFGHKPLRSPTIKGKELSNTKEYPFPDALLSSELLQGDLLQAVDGGSGVGFFELDEEIASPGFGEVRPFEFDDGPASEDQNKAHEKLKHTRDDLDLDEEAYLKTTYELSGSVPINISRPSGSWIGSFGH
jgi:hypothetical protein